MDSNLIMLVMVAWGLVLLLGLVFMKMASDQDRAARRTEKRLIPHSDVTITQYGSS
jgi:hypothetical protein